MKQTKSLEAELLQLYLELYTMTPNQKNWSNETFKDNPPRLYRYQNMCAIAKALKIHTIYFSGEKWHPDFIGKSQMRRWFDIESLAKNNFNCRLDYIKSTDKLNILTLRDMFDNLIEVAINYYNNIIKKECILLASGYNYVNLEILQNIAKKNKDYIKEVKEVLHLLINPNCITCPKSILIDEFGYKDIDFEELDFEWI